MLGAKTLNKSKSLKIHIAHNALLKHILSEYVVLGLLIHKVIDKQYSL